MQKFFLLKILPILGIHSLCNAYVPMSDLSRDDMAGIWRLTGKKSLLPSVRNEKEASLNFASSALKEFTVFPIRKKENDVSTPTELEQIQELFIKLLEDGSFVQFGKFDESDMDYEDDDYDEDDLEDEQQLSQNGGKTDDAKVSVDESSILGLSVAKGTWDYLDGKLILASDRPTASHPLKVHDTILEGMVVATSEKSLTDNPALSKSNVTASSDESVQSQVNSLNSEDIDTHLSVPKGTVKVGKFMYPKDHPSFFEQTIFRPTKAGSFELRQVLGSLNTKTNSNEELIEKFKREDFYGRRFFLTSRPLKYEAKGKLIWNRSLGRYVSELGLL